jgi:hypothetical protein
VGQGGDLCARKVRSGVSTKFEKIATMMDGGDEVVVLERDRASRSRSSRPFLTPELAPTSIPSPETTPGSRYHQELPSGLHIVSTGRARVQARSRAGDSRIGVGIGIGVEHHCMREEGSQPTSGAQQLLQTR